MSRSALRISAILALASSVLPSVSSTAYSFSIFITASSVAVMSWFRLATWVPVWNLASWRSRSARFSRSLLSTASWRDSGMRVSLPLVLSALSSFSSSSTTFSPSLAASSASRAAAAAASAGPPLPASASAAAAAASPSKSSPRSSVSVPPESRSADIKRRRRGWFRVRFMLCSLQRVGK